MRVLHEAFEYMVVGHKGQKYGDLPYYTHPANVALEVRNLFSDCDDTTIIAALFHDLVEDTAVTLEDIEKGWGKDVRDIVELVTKDENLTYQENILRIVESGNAKAMQVKYADNTVNMAGDKSHMTESKKNRLEEKHKWSINTLEQALESHK